MPVLEIQKDGLLFDGKPFYMICGDIHYFRIHPSGWAARLELMKDFGLNTLQVYCPWNAHEPWKGQYDFSGINDLSAFLSLAESYDFKVILRPSPFICAEWENGGLPWWLVKESDIELRCSHPKFLVHVADYLKRICQEFVPHLSTNGGCVIAVDIENEYGGFGSDLEYMKFLVTEYEKNGVDVPFYQTDNTDGALRVTRPLGIWQGVNYRIESDTAIPMLREIQPDKPAFVGEYWSGRSVYWGEDGRGREVEPIAKAYRTALEMGAYVSFYMFCGGTNFGFMNGARVVAQFFDPPGSPKKYRPIVTSYDVDALVSEDGIATEKYYACRKELDEFLGREVRTYKLPESEKQEILGVQLDLCAPLFDNLENIATPSIQSVTPLTFEALDCPYGFVLYTATIPGGFPMKKPLDVNGVKDRAMLFADGNYLGTIQRDREHPPIELSAEKEVRLDILVENMGRNNTRPEFPERGKGIDGEVIWTETRSRLYHWENKALPMDDFSGLKFTREIKTGTPAFFKGSFQAKAGIDTCLHTKGLGRGFAVINGFNVGRFWSVGPQETLYVPGGILKDGENELIIFELHTDAAAYRNEQISVNFVKRHILAGDFKDDIL